MKSSEVSAFLPIIKAFGEGKTVQFIQNSRWVDVTPGYCLCFDRPVSHYRIKPEPTWRPWKLSEVPQHFMVESIDNSEFPIPSDGGTNHSNAFLAVVLTSGYIRVRSTTQYKTFSLDNMFRYFMRLDEQGNATPCGVLENP